MLVICANLHIKRAATGACMHACMHACHGFPVALKFAWACELNPVASIYFMGIPMAWNATDCTSTPCGMVHAYKSSQTNQLLATAEPTAKSATSTDSGTALKPLPQP